MKLWSIQTQEAWNALKRDGLLTGKTEFVELKYRAAYDWMISQMRLRLSDKPATPLPPVWTWHQWENQRRARPDLRCGSHLPKDSRGVLLELGVSPDRVLLSDFELWHYALNYWYLPATIREGEAFEKKVESRGLSFYKDKPLPDASLHEEIVRSWERIFDLDFAEPELASPRKGKSIQATLWELRASDVQSVREFTAR